MARVKSSAQIELLERQQRELLAKLKDAKAKARADEREKRLDRAKIAGLAFLDELDENPNGDATRALLAVLNSRLLRRADREAFGLGDPPPKADISAQAARPKQKLSYAEVAKALQGDQAAAGSSDDAVA